MDLLDYCDGNLYFEETLPPEAEGLLIESSRHFATEQGEVLLLRAFLLAPDHLAILVELYRYYSAHQRLPEALRMAERAMQLAARRLDLPGDWQRLDDARLANAAISSFGLLRFYLLALKSASVLLLRLGRVDASRLRLNKLAALDRRDQLGAARLLEALDAFVPRPSVATPCVAFA